MAPHKLRKIRKKRGSRTHGWGQVGQHRKKSVKGSRKVGRHKHLWTYIIKHEPEYFGKRGFKSPKSLRSQVNVINVGQLDELVTKLEMEKQLEKKGGKPLLDLEKLGYQKLLGTGKLTRAITLKVPFCSERAAQKVEEAGGKIIGATSETQQS